MTDTITLSGIISLRRLAVTLPISNVTLLPWLCNLLRSGYSTSVTQHLEELSIWALYASSYTRTRENIPILWKPLFDALLEDELKNLRVLNIFMARYSTTNAMVVLDTLNGCEAVAKLRRLPGLILNVRGEDQWTFSELRLAMGISFIF